MLIALLLVVPVGVRQELLEDLSMRFLAAVLMMFAGCADAERAPASGARPASGDPAPPGGPQPQTSSAVRPDAPRSAPSGTAALARRRRLGGVGEHDMASMDRAMERAIPSLSLCYSVEMAKGGVVEGKLGADMTIGEDGHAFELVLHGSLSGHPVGHCLRAILEQLSVEPAPRGGSVRYRYEYSLQRGVDRKAERKR